MKRLACFAEGRVGQNRLAKSAIARLLSSASGDCIKLFNHETRSDVEMAPRFLRQVMREKCIVGIRSIGVLIAFLVI